LRFRTKALAKRRQAEELDQLPEVAEARGWLAAVALGVVVVGLLVALLVVEVPRRVEAGGALSSGGGLAEVQSPRAGEVVAVLVGPGDRVTAGQPVAQVAAAADGRATPVRSRVSGRVLRVSTRAGRFVVPGTSLVTLAAAPGEAATGAWLFVDPDDAGTIAPGMEVDVEVVAAPAARYGSVPGRITSVGAVPASPQELAVLVANDGLVSRLVRDGPPVIAAVRLERARTPSGLRWTGGSGPPAPLPPGSPVRADVQQGGQRVIDMLLGR
jgi:biotin carboxyl carrier protein